MNNILDKAFDLALTIVGGTDTPPQNATETGLYTSAQPRETGSETARPGAKLSAEARRELTPKIKRTLPPGVLDSVAHATPGQERAYDLYIGELGYQEPEADKLKLKALDPAYLRLQAAVAECSRSQRGKHLAHLEDIAARIAAGDMTAHASDAWSAQDWEDDARERMKAFKAELRKVETQAWQIAEPVLLAKAEFLDNAADRLEDEARPIFEKFCAPFRVPSYILTMRKYAESLRNGSRKTCGLPSAMLAAQ